jgi:hypothetical protein
MDDLELAIRKTLADEMRTSKDIKARCGYCTGLARKIESGQDNNPRTLAAIFYIRRLLEVTATSSSSAD